MPDPIPARGLARLAVDRKAQGIQLGGSLLREALERTHAVASHAGIRALLAHALHERAKAFCEHHGFRSSPLDPMAWMLALARATPQALGDASIHSTHP